MAWRVLGLVVQSFVLAHESIDLWRILTEFTQPRELGIQLLSLWLVLDAVYV